LLLAIVPREAIMRLNRIFCDGPLASAAELPLPPAGAYHVARVLRMREGAPLSIFDGTGQEYRAEIVRLTSDEVIVRLGEPTAGASESPLRITLLQGVSRSERMDWTLQKATELGVAAIAPVLTARSVVRLDEKQAQKKQVHWRGIVIAACEQCGRSKIPAVAAPVGLREHLASSRKEGLRLVLSPSAPGSLAGLASLPTKVELLIGPEGGLDDDELLAAQKAGFVPVRLGPRVLRTETAAVVALTVLQALWGDLQ
jgi:16S rRNA (uracil1498-N3)-methyltransferase